MREEVFRNGSVRVAGINLQACSFNHLVKAKKAYDDLFTLWKDADADVPVIKQARAKFDKLSRQSCKDTTLKSRPACPGAVSRVARDS